MSVGDREWEAWAEDWRAEPGDDPPPDLLRRVRRQGRLMLALTVAELLFSGAMLGFSTWFVWSRPRPLWVVWLVAVWVFTLVAQAYSLVNRAGTWRPAAQTTRAFLELCHRRCLRKLRTVRFVPWLLAAELGFLVAFGLWLYLSGMETPVPGLPIYLEAGGWASALTLGYCLWLVWYRRRALRELAQLEELQRGLEG